ncbi:MAG TPA: DmsC/YnfH family molybdoenzyme membrane anchor subunit [Vicinamibacterales bacterium]|jgi:anaerobic dimethyl sulfoxide reductase subunit C (anchor subunit)
MTAGRREWPLVAFTLLAQAAVGGFLAIGVARVHLQPALGGAVAGVVRLPLVVVSGLFALSLLASLGHLGRPLAAWRALCHAAESWVSIEILMAVAFGGALTAFLSAETLEIATSAVHEVLAGITAGLGVGLVHAMGQIYRLPTRPAWNHVTTVIGFYVTTALLGLLVAGSCLLGGYASLGPPSAFPERVLALDCTLRLLALAAAAACGFEAVLIPWQMRLRRKASLRASLPESDLSLLRHQRIATVRLALVGAAMAASAWFVFREPALSGAEPLGAFMLASACLLALLESLLGRVMFYTKRPIHGV